MESRHRAGAAVLVLVTLATAGCITLGDANAPIATVAVPATQDAPEHPLIVVLPGFGSDAQTMSEHQVGETIHQSWPQADVLLTSATFAYYAHRSIVQRLEQDVIAPARRQGYRQIWLAGASIGGMGLLFYEHEHPGELAGLIFFAPWLGDRAIQDEIRAAGGVRAWEPGPVPAVIDGDNYQREMWRVIKSWTTDPAAAQRVWMVCGTGDRMLAGDRLMASALPASHYLEVPGGHTWETWLRSVHEVLALLLGNRVAAGT